MYRFVPLPDWYLEDLNYAYDLSRRKKDTYLKSQPIWTWDRHRIRRRIMKMMKKAGIDISQPYACPKGLRHSFAVELLMKGVDISQIRLLLGHAWIGTTERYLRLIPGDQRLPNPVQIYSGRPPCRPSCPPPALAPGCAAPPRRCGWTPPPCPPPGWTPPPRTPRWWRPPPVCPGPSPPRTTAACSLYRWECAAARGSLCTSCPLPWHAVWLTAHSQK